jgi:hypothetical protein
VLNRAKLTKTNLSGANLFKTCACRTDLTEADLSGADLSNCYSHEINLHKANLYKTNLSGAELIMANLSKANLTEAKLHNTRLNDANLTDTIGLTKPMNVKPGDTYWKRFGPELINFEYQFKVGLNELRPGEVFASDERVMCSFPGFHFASREWCTENYPERPYEAKIRIPLDAKINESWGTDGKASADKIEILQVFEVSTGKDVTDLFKL